MNKVTVAVGAGALAAVLAGCGPDLAQTSYGEKEEQWQRVIRENYPQYEAPRTAPPAVRDNVSPRLLEEERLRQDEKAEAAEVVPAVAPEASEDPEVTVDRAAEKAPANTDAAAKAEKTPAKAAKPAPAPKAAPAPVAGEKYVVKYGDTLEAISRKYYGDPRNSDVIMRANPQLTDPNRLRVGMTLVIPKI